MKWQPIKTAPNNQRDILVFCSDTKEQFVAFKFEEGLYQFASYDGVSIACEPTHWMPLPESPEEENHEKPSA